jgi:hypothetical protein
LFFATDAHPGHRLNAVHRHKARGFRMNQLICFLCESVAKPLKRQLLPVVSLANSKRLLFAASMAFLE